MAEFPKTFEEGVASLLIATDDTTVNEAAAGRHGKNVRLLALGEKIRREMQKRSAA